MDHRINMRQPLPLTPLFPGLNLTYALKLLHFQSYPYIKVIGCLAVWFASLLLQNGIERDWGTEGCRNLKKKER